MNNASDIYLWESFIQWCYRLGQVENARRHISFPGLHPDPAELKKLQTVEKHLNKCSDARRVGDWKSVLREGDAAIAAGADHCPQVRPNNFLRSMPFSE